MTTKHTTEEKCCDKFPFCPFCSEHQPKPDGAGMRGLVIQVPFEETLNELVRDLTRVGGIPKSEAINRIHGLIRSELSRLHSRIVEEVEKIKKPTNTENKNTYTIADCNTEYNTAKDQDLEIINKAFKDL